MKTSKLALSSAIAGLLTMASLPGSALAHDPAAPKDKDKCYGIALKGMNDCGTATHSCAGQAKTDKGPDDWKFVAKGSCEAQGGRLKKPESKGPGTK